MKKYKVATFYGISNLEMRSPARHSKLRGVTKSSPFPWYLLFIGLIMAILYSLLPHPQGTSFIPIYIPMYFH